MDAIHTALLLTAVSGYGDMDEAGFPSYEERAVHFWTNAARVDPAAFRDDYPCQWTSFQNEEQEPKAPLFYSRPLNEAGRYHSEDMNDEGWFDHDSSPGGEHPFAGRDFGSRVAYWYTESYTVGENIAWGYTPGFDVVMGGWMCSGGHRANIMSDWYNELGTGVAGTYSTQDFGGGAADTEMNLAMGLHEPGTTTAGSTVDFYVDYVGPGPSSVVVMLNGVPHDMVLEYGEENQGVFATTVEIGEGCTEYWFQALDDEGESAFPQDGSYTVGDCEGVEWVEWQLSPGNMGEDGDEAKNKIPGWLQWWYDRRDGSESEDEVSACSSAPANAGWALVLLAGLMAVRRRD